MGSRVGWKRRIFQRDRWICYYCGCTCHGRDPLRTDFATVDHKFPLSRGGDSREANMVTACRGCNEGKGSMTVAEFERAGKPRREYIGRKLSAGTALKLGYRPAQAMSTGTAKTPQAAEGRSPASAVGSADAPNPANPSHPEP